MFSLIMVGGRGTRFWPVSRIKHPKQLIDFTGRGPMIKLTVDRLLPLIPVEKHNIVTSKHLVSPIQEILKDINSEKIFGEPIAKNTAPCLAFICGLLMEKYSEEILGVFPADHYIGNELKFIEDLRFAENLALEKDSIITLGIQPTSANTGFGYIEFSSLIAESSNNTKAFKVERFREKPDKIKAEEFLKAGNFLWNAGIFVAKIKNIINAYKKYEPEMYESILRISDALKNKSKNIDTLMKEEYEKAKSISIDYAIMEKSDNIITIKSDDLDWNDIGTWTGLEKINKKDENNNIVLSEKTEFLNSKNNIIYSKNNKKIISLIDIDDIVIVDTDDALLICKKSSDQNVNKIVKKLEEKNSMHYL